MSREWIAAFGAAVLAACPANAQSLEPGAWRSLGYGYLVDVKPDQTRLFEVSRSFCRLTDIMPTATLGEAIGPIENVARGRSALASPTKRIELFRVPELPSVCPQTVQGPDVDPVHNFDALWEAFDEHYAYFALRHVDWRDVRGRFRPRFEALGSGGDPWPLMTELLSAFDDRHVHLSDGSRRFQGGARSPTREPDGFVATTPALHAALGEYLAESNSPLSGQVHTEAFGRLVYGVSSEGVGYIAVLTMGGFAHGPDGWPGNTSDREDAAAAAAAIDAVLRNMGGTKGLVLDLRYNPGGSDLIADAIAARFADRKRLAFTRQARAGRRLTAPTSVYVSPARREHFSRPLVVLTSRRTTSAAEALVMMLRVLPQVTVIGQNTQGAHSDVLTRTLPNGWTLGLSNEVLRLADGRVYEGVGIPPDRATPSNPPANREERFGRDIRFANRLVLAQSG